MIRKNDTPPKQPDIAPESEGEQLMGEQEPSQVPADASLIELAEIAEQIESASHAQQKSLSRIIDQLDTISEQLTPFGGIAQKGTPEALSGTKRTIDVLTGDNQGQEEGKKENQKEPKKAQSGTKKDTKPRLELERRAKKRPIETVDGSKGAKKGPISDSTTKDRSSESGRRQSGYNPAKRRSDRTITVGEPQKAGARKEGAPSDLGSLTAAVERNTEATKQAADATSKTPAASRGERTEQGDRSIPPVQGSQAGQGFYMDATGRLRRADGTFASKIEVKRYNKERNQTVEERNQKTGPLANLVRAIGKLTGHGTKNLAETDTGDAAGVATGGSFWQAAKELKKAGDDLKGSLERRDIRSVSDAGKFIKGKAKGITDLFGRKSDDTEADQANTAATSADAAEPAQGGSPAQSAEPGATATGEPDKPATSQAITAENKRASQEQAIADDANDQADSRHGELLGKLDDLIKAVKPKSGSLVDKAIGKVGESWGRRRGRRGAGRTGRQRQASGGTRGGSTSSRVTTDRARGSTDRSRDLPTGRRDSAGRDVSLPERQGRTQRQPRIRQAGQAGRGARGTGRVARMAAAVPRVMPGLASVSTVAGAAGGALSAAPAAAGAIGRGAMAVGGRAVPLIGAAMAAYDAYEGFNDQEAHQRTFNLKDGQEATTGQKSATAAARVLDLGGLVSGGMSLLGEGAGALGMTNLQEAMTFNADDMAKGIYGMFTMDREREAMGIGKDEETSLGQRMAMSFAKSIDAGGLLSKTVGTLGKVAEDLGVKGAAEATDFDAGDLAVELYKFFGGTMAQDKIGRAELVKSSAERYSAPGAAQGVGVTSQDVKGAKVYDFSSVEQEYGLPEGHMSAMAGVESNGNPMAYNKSSGAAGMFQFIPSTAKAMGLKDPYNVQQSAAAAAQLSQDNARYFNKKMGRTPEGRELYLMHQQGMGGGTALIKAMQENPNMSAVEALAKGGQKDAMGAVMANGGRADMTAAEFAELQMRKYDKHYLAQQQAKAQGGKVIAPENAVKEAIKDATPDYPFPYRNGAAPDSLVAERKELGKASAEPVQSNFSRVLDIQAEQARAAQSEDAELTAKLDPRMLTALTNIERALKDSGPTTTPSAGNSTTNNTVTVAGVNGTRDVSGHDSFSDIHADIARDRG